LARGGRRIRADTSTSGTGAPVLARAPVRQGRASALTSENRGFREVLPGPGAPPSPGPLVLPSRRPTVAVCLPTSRWHTRRSRTSCSPALRKPTRGVCCVIGSFSGPLPRAPRSPSAHLLGGARSCATCSPRGRRRSRRAAPAFPGALQAPDAESPLKGSTSASGARTRPGASAAAHPRGARSRPPARGEPSLLGRERPRGLLGQKRPKRLPPREVLFGQPPQHPV